MTTSTITIESREEREPVEELVLRLRAPRSPPHVTWAADVVDNEHLGRLKSNCCCIYVKPRKWDDPTTWEQDEHETEHCRGHTLPERKPQDNSKEPKDENHDCGCGGC